MISRQFMTYVSVGVLSAGVDIATMEVLIHLRVHYEGAVSLGYVIGLVVNYIFHARVTFRKASSGATIVKFGNVVFLNYLITMLCVAVSQHWFSSVLVGKLASLPLVAVNGFLQCRYWVFR